jgi:hypothetical protein
MYRRRAIVAHRRATFSLASQRVLTLTVILLDREMGGAIPALALAGTAPSAHDALRGPLRPFDVFVVSAVLTRDAGVKLHQ